MRARFSFLFGLIILVAASSSCSSATLQTSATALPVTPSATFPATANLPIPTKTPISQIDLSCWTVKPLESGNGVPGSFVFEHYNHFIEGVGSKLNSFFAWDVSSFHTLKLNVDIDSFRSSLGQPPLGFTVRRMDGNQLIMLTENDLVFMSKARAQFIPLPKNSMPETTGPQSQQLPGTWLFAKGVQSYNYELGSLGLTDTYYLLDPKTKEVSKHDLFLPDFYDGYWWQGYGIYYSPDMKYVLYRSKPLIRNGYAEDRFTLYDIAKKSVVWITPAENSDFVLDGGDPHWIPNTDTITAEYRDRNTDARNYYLVSIEGVISPLNDLDHAPGTSLVAARGGHATDWSSSGRYLVASYPPTYVWDTQAKRWYKPCLPNEEKSDPAMTYRPIWSPDGQHYMATLWYGFLPGPTPPWGRVGTHRTFIVDVLNKVIYELPASIPVFDNMTGNPDGEGFPPLYKDGYDRFVGWVNWELP